MKKAFSKMRIVSFLCAVTMFAGCSGETKPEETTVNVNETLAVPSAVETAAVSEETADTETPEKTIILDEDAGLYVPSENVDEDMISDFLSGFVINETKPSVMSDENAEKLEEAFKNIRINNSRFALPMMILALPDGFSVKLDHDSRSEEPVIEDFYSYDGELYMGYELCTSVEILLKDNAKEKYGIIIGFSGLMSVNCKWSFGDISYSNDIEKIISCFGKPSIYEKITDNLSYEIYVTQKGDIVAFVNELNSIICMSVNTDVILENSLLTEYVPYDDFDDIPEIPNVSGGSRDIDWNIIFDNDCVVIGNDRYPANAQISDLSDDIVLFDYDIGQTYDKNDNYLQDHYVFLYKGRDIGVIGALRKIGEQPKNGIITSWMFTNVIFPAGVMGIPLSQSSSSISKVYTPDNEISGTIVYRGAAERNGESYTCMFAITDSSILFGAEPDFAD